MSRLRPRWTPEDVERLRALAEVATKADAARDLGRCPAAIIAKARQHGIVFQRDGRAKRWTPAEDALLRELASTMTSRKVAALMQGRNRVGVVERALKIGVKFALREVAHKEERAWTPREVQKLWSLAGRATLVQIARKLGRTEEAVRSKLRRLGARSRSSETARDIAKRLGIGHSTVLRHRNLLGQTWRKKHSPRGPEIEEVIALAKSVLDSRGGGASSMSPSHLKRIIRGEA